MAFASSPHLLRRRRPRPSWRVGIFCDAEIFIIFATSKLITLLFLSSFLSPWNSFLLFLFTSYPSFSLFHRSYFFFLLLRSGKYFSRRDMEIVPRSGRKGFISQSVHINTRLARLVSTRVCHVGVREIYATRVARFWRKSHRHLHPRKQHCGSSTFHLAFIRDVEMLSGYKYVTAFFFLNILLCTSLHLLFFCHVDSFKFNNKF